MTADASFIKITQNCTSYVDANLGSALIINLAFSKHIIYNDITRCIERTEFNIEIEFRY